MQEYKEANKLYIYTILFILFVSVTGISTLTDSYLISLSISQLSMALPAVVYLVGRKNNILNRLGLGKVKVIPVLSSVVMGFSIIPFISLINTVSMFFVRNVTETKVSVAAEQYPLWLMLIIVAVLPAMVEELLYRGIYFGVYRKSGVLKGAIIAALLFAFMHGNLNQFAYAVVAGFLFAMIDYAGGSVIYSIIMHVIINGTSVVALYSDKIQLGIIQKLAEEKEYTSLWAAFTDLGPWAALGLVITAAGYMIIRKTGNTVEEETNDYPVADVYLGVGIIIMLINIIANEVY
ncbi:MAG: lysostaphin resistance A-like protein [Lachnospiraceae bacterium]